MSRDLVRACAIGRAATLRRGPGPAGVRADGLFSPAGWDTPTWAQATCGGRVPTCRAHACGGRPAATSVSRPASAHGLRKSGLDDGGFRLERLRGRADGTSTRNPGAAASGGPGDDGRAVGRVDYQHLSTLLWREQELLDLLLFKAEEKQYLILAGKTRWLSRIAHEIEVVLDQLRTLEVERAAATEAIAGRLGLDANPSLRQLAEKAPAPWNDLFTKHHEALLVLVTDLRSLSDHNRELIEGGLAVFGDALLSVRAPSAGTYGSTGRAHDSGHRAVTLDGAL